MSHREKRGVCLVQHQQVDVVGAHAGQAALDLLEQLLALLGGASTRSRLLHQPVALHLQLVERFIQSHWRDEGWSKIYALNYELL